MRTPLKTFTGRHAQFSDSHLDSIHTHVAQVLSPSPHPHVMVICLFVVVSCSYSFLLFLLELPIELDNPIVMESLRDFAENESEDTLNAFTSPTGYEPKFLTFGELYNPSVPLSLRIPLSDQDMDDVALGKMLTEAHRGQANYCVPEGLSVSQSSSLRFERSGQPGDRERSGQPDGESSSKAQNRTLLEEQRQTIIAQ